MVISLDRRMKNITFQIQSLRMKFRSMIKHLGETIHSYESKQLSTLITKSLLSVKYAGGLAWQV